MSGFGQIIFKNMVLEGEFKDGLLNGKGIQKGPNYWYEGDWINGKKYGFGTEILDKNQY